MHFTLNVIQVLCCYELRRRKLPAVPVLSFARIQQRIRRRADLHEHGLVTARRATAQFRLRIDAGLRNRHQHRLEASSGHCSAATGPGERDRDVDTGTGSAAAATGRLGRTVPG